MNYFADGVKSDSNESVLNGVPIIKKVSYKLLHVFFSSFCRSVCQRIYVNLRPSVGGKGLSK